jgi:hypothetical protein
MGMIEGVGDLAADPNRIVHRKLDFPAEPVPE